jgi:hypothetical protein
MYYNNALYKFKLPDEAPDSVAGSVLNASSMCSAQFMRRDFRRYPYLQHRVFDPQLYLAGLDRNGARETVAKLATWPWFVRDVAAVYDSTEHGTLKQWEERFQPDLIRAWPGRPATDPAQITQVVRECIKTQVELGCEAIILPSPLTTIAATDYELETAYLDVGISEANELQVNVPVLATVALTDNLLRGSSPLEHPLLHTISSQIAARDRLAGAYIVLEQANEAGYACTSRESVLSMLLLVDDFTRGAAKTVYVNFMGNFGAVLSAAGAAVWSSGYYLSQRRLQLAHFDDAGGGPAYPRLYSLRLAGDIGLERDLPAAHAAGLTEHVVTRTGPSERVRRALVSNSYPEAVPDWQYRPNNIGTAASHYYEVAQRNGAFLSALSPTQRIQVVERWLNGAVRMADELERAGIQRTGTHTDLVHQQIWLDAFTEWRRYANR